MRIICLLTAARLIRRQVSNLKHMAGLSTDVQIEDPVRWVKTAAGDGSIVVKCHKCCARLLESTTPGNKVAVTQINLEARLC